MVSAVYNGVTRTTTRWGTGSGRNAALAQRYSRSGLGSGPRAGVTAAGTGCGTVATTDDEMIGRDEWIDRERENEPDQMANTASAATPSKANRNRVRSWADTSLVPGSAIIPEHTWCHHGPAHADGTL